MTAHIRPVTISDAPQLATIYSHYALSSIVTFDLQSASTEDFQERITSVCDAGRPWLVIEEDGVVHGYASAYPYRPKPAYSQTVETSVYVAPESQGRGLGRAVYSAMLDRLPAAGVHTAIALIALPHVPSEALHRDLGFTHVGTLREVGRKFDRWIDVATWQRHCD